MAIISAGCGDSVQQRIWRSRSLYLSPEHVTTTAQRGANKEKPMNKKCICIFDLDGTLSDGTHRLHLLPKKDLHLTESWSEFNGASIGDSPIQSTIDVANALHRSGMIVVILTGRSDEVKTDTMIWLDRYGVKYDRLIMRRASDNRKDTIIKEEELRKIGLERIVAAWDDSPNVIAHLRGLGITTYQVCDYGNNIHDHLKSHGVDK
nr:MAG TPA: hypothetical protein [Caudoviricetes sp.]